MKRFVGIDLGAETVKVAEVYRENGRLALGRTWLREHGKEPARTLKDLLAEIGWEAVDGAAATGRLASTVRLDRIPLKTAVSEGVALLHPDLPGCTIVSIGAHGFAVIDLLENGVQRIRENSRCSQGTGNFLRQLVHRLDLSLSEADSLCENAKDAAPLSGRCPVVLKTDMTHLANKGVDRSRILAGLYDAVCENVQTLIRPNDSSRRLLLIGGVARAGRVRRRFGRLAGELGMEFVKGRSDRFLEAFGAARFAVLNARAAVGAHELFAEEINEAFESSPPLNRALSKVHRMKGAVRCDRRNGDVILGFDMGSTGSKLVAVDIATKKPAWEAYGDTLGDPVSAAQRLVAWFLEDTGGAYRVCGAGVTGSGREIVGSLLAGCYGSTRVYIMNEIAAHAEGALAHDSEVDTIFEIGGQDAKYIRLDGGRICDAAMNEACSAGTGSFIEEQGISFKTVRGVTQMGQCALAADRGISLGQHCSVFMAEVIDQAIAEGEPIDAILAGIYDSVVQNYLNRVKGTRTIGKRIFCQGMPFTSDALAAAVARRTGRDVVVPPNPGTIGSVGIALLACRELAPDGVALRLESFLEAKVERKDQFVCRSTKGCGGSGNRCRIDRMLISIGDKRNRFVWGGSCSLYDRGTRRRTLPDRTPNPFHEREKLVDDLVGSLNGNKGCPRVAITDEFSLKGLFPFFAVFLHRLGFDLLIHRGGTQVDLKRGIQYANVPYCAPMQLSHGVTARMLDDAPDYLFAPMVRDLPRVGDEPYSTTCPIVQGSPGLIDQAFMRDHRRTRLLSPTIEMGPEGIESESFSRRSCMQLACTLGVKSRWVKAYEEARAAQKEFEGECLEIGRRAHRFAQEHDLPAVIILGRTYTIYNEVLNSNVPNLLRELGAMAIPVDCYPVEDRVPTFQRVFWHYSQVNLRAAHQIRRTEGVYSVFCSNYACGPDSFNLPFYRYIMENKPFCLIETDGHSGDAGTKTRLEAFLYCVAEDRKTPPRVRAARRRNDFVKVENDFHELSTTRGRGEVLLINRMGVGANVLGAVLRGEGFLTEVLPPPNRDDLEAGRRYTSGKECVPLTITLGNVLRHLERKRDSNERLALLMPTSNGPCRFGAYSVLYNITLEQTGWRDRVRIVSPSDTNYFAGLSTDFSLRTWIGFVAADVLLAALHDVRPVEESPGMARRIFDRYFKELLWHMAQPSRGQLVQTLRQATSREGGVRDLVRRAAAEFARVKDFARRIPTVGLVGEIYVRLDPFANDFVIRRLEAEGLRVRLAPFHEWVEYATWMRKSRITSGRPLTGDDRLETWFSTASQAKVADTLYREMGRPLRWGRRTPVHETVAAASRYVSPELEGEAILTVGAGLYEYLRGEIDGVVSVGPLECMPNKIAESHFHRAESDFGLPSLTLSLNGDRLDPQLIEAFAFEVKDRSDRRHRRHRALLRPHVSLGDVVWRASGRLTLSALQVMPQRFTARKSEVGPQKLSCRSIGKSCLPASACNADVKGRQS